MWGCPYSMSNKRTIVLDLDGVISNIALAIDEWLENKEGIDPNECDYSSWLITDSKDEKAMSIFNNPLFWKNMKPYDDSWHRVNEWFYDGVDVHIVTARRCEAAINQTQPWLDMWRINTMPPVFANINRKHEIIEVLKPQFVVEDNPHEVSALRSHGIDAYLRKQWYNKEFWNDLPTIDGLWDIDWK